jgi:hypothetical protein
MTHDEAGTYMFFHDVNFKDFFTEKSSWSSANNHLLNTLSYKIVVSIAGHSDLNIRLGNVLSFLIYLMSIFYIGKGYFKNYSSRILLFTLLVINPYLLDFFSLSRGYGMSIAFLMLAYWMFWEFFYKERKSYYILAFFALAMSTFSIMSNLIFIPSIALSIWIVFIANYRKYKLSIPLYLFLVPVIAFILLVGILYVPLTALAGLDEFRFGTRSITRPFTSLVANSVSSFYFSKITDILICGLFFSGLLLSIYSSLKRYFLTENKYNNFYAFLGISFIVLMLGLLAAYLFMGSRFPVDRKSLMFVPLLGLLFTSLIDRYNKINNIKPIVSLLILLFVAHFIYAFVMNETIEWRYDAYTEEVIDFIVADANEENVVIGSHWFHNPSLNYYKETKLLSNIKVSKYNKEVEADKIYDYFVVLEGEDYKKIKNKYDQLYQTKSGILVLKKKEGEK